MAVAAAAGVAAAMAVAAAVACLLLRAADEERSPDGGTRRWDRGPRGFRGSPQIEICGLLGRGHTRDSEITACMSGRTVEKRGQGKGVSMLRRVGWMAYMSLTLEAKDQKARQAFGHGPLMKLPGPPQVESVSQTITWLKV